MLFLDEPFAALDAITREELQEDLLRICKMNQMTVLFVTHDISEAVYLSDWISVMNEGKIIYDVHVKIGDRQTPQIRYAQHFNELCMTVRAEISGG